MKNNDIKRNLYLGEDGKIHVSIESESEDGMSFDELEEQVEMATKQMKQFLEDGFDKIKEQLKRPSSSFIYTFSDMLESPKHELNKRYNTTTANTMVFVWGFPPKDEDGDSDWKYTVRIIFSWDVEKDIKKRSLSEKYNVIYDIFSFHRKKDAPGNGKLGTFGCFPARLSIDRRNGVLRLDKSVNMRYIELNLCEDDEYINEENGEEVNEAIEEIIDVFDSAFKKRGY